ncbi:MAG TPA: NAD(P)-dependent oxidoreductase [Spirochaetia bacterium]|nr:NAD(P)-dependent oxidoreductase [Spirochaetia bacterium]
MSDAKPRLLIDPSPRTMREIFTDQDLARVRGLYDVVWGRDDPISQEAFDREKRDLFAVACCGWRYGSIQEMARLRVLLDVCGGPPRPDQLDYASCFERRIAILNCSPAFGPVVAEMALGMALDAAREISFGDREFRAASEHYLHSGNVHTLSLFGSAVGLIGYGSLARNLQPLLAPFRCRISVYDPWKTEAQLRGAGVTPATLDEVLRGSDVIFVLAQPTTGNKAMITRRHLELIQPHKVFVLISRSHVVDFDALTDLALQDRFKAAIDVFPEEPLAKDHPIRKAPGAVLSAHRAGALPVALLDIGRMVADDLEAIIRGLPPWRMQRTEPELAQKL